MQKERERERERERESNGKVYIIKARRSLLSFLVKLLCAFKGYFKKFHWDYFLSEDIKISGHSLLVNRN